MQAGWSSTGRGKKKQRQPKRRQCVREETDSCTLKPVTQTRIVNTLKDNKNSKTGCPDIDSIGHMKKEENRVAVNSFFLPPFLWQGTDENVFPV
jgi:hypothetical protein